MRDRTKPRLRYISAEEERRLWGECWILIEKEIDENEVAEDNG
jgi:hypothetical protein